MIRRNQKRLAIRSYVKSLGPQLRKRYGASRYYTPEQVKATVREYHLNSNWLSYALCMYCDYDSFIQYHFDIGETCDYGAMQSEIAGQFSRNHASFNKGNASMVNGDVTSYGYGWVAGGFSGSDCGGGFDSGGSCDGGGGY